MGQRHSASADLAVQQARALQQRGQLAQARALGERALQLQPRHFDALMLLGVLAAQLKSPAQAERWFREASEVQPNSAVAHNNLGNARRELSQPAIALASYDRAISLKPDYAVAHSNRGNALRDLRQYDAALASYEQAIGLNGNLASAHYNRGNVLNDLGRHEAAIASYDRALWLKPEYADAHFNRGCGLQALGRHQEAVASFDKAITLNSNQPTVHYRRGNALAAMGQYAAAAASYERVVSLDPRHAEALNNLGNAFSELHAHAQAVASYDAALAIQPDYAEAHHNRGNALRELGEVETALASYQRALALKPDFSFLPGICRHLKMHLCDWRDHASDLSELSARIERGEPVSDPFSILSLSDSLELQAAAARIWVRERPAAATEPLPPLEKPAQSGRLRVGYFSADFRNHPVAGLTAEFIELHDRMKFEVFGFSFGPDTRDELRVRMEKAFDHFVDVRRASDRDIAALARELRVDIAVDLGGFTQGSRPGIFSLRAAPLQISYLGYLGTMSADYMDYLIADRTIVPPHQQRYYREKIIYLPGYQPNDSKRRIAEHRFTRDELGLPPGGFVYCCFNASYKLTPETFAGWMRILDRVPQSVLLLLGGAEGVERNLRQEAQRRGIDAGRLVFGARLPLPQYLARYRAADLFLDTLPYNAGATASDALWAGLPVLTCLGNAFAGRVAASLLHSVDLPELITSTPAQYEQLAVQLASQPDRLLELRRRLSERRNTALPFDTQRFARYLEAAYIRVHDRYQADLAPEHIEIDS